MKLVNSDNSDILIIDEYPPPYGCVTVHIKRFHDNNQKNYVRLIIITQFGTVTFPNVMANKLIKIIHFIWTVHSSNGRVIHVHFSRFNNLLWGGWLIYWFGKSNIRELSNRTSNFQLDHKNKTLTMLI